MPTVTAPGTLPLLGALNFAELRMSASGTKRTLLAQLQLFSCIPGQRSVMYQTAIYRILAAGNIGCVIGQEK